MSGALSTPVFVNATLAFPIVNVHDLEMLSGQEVVERSIAGCTIYCITQRSALYFDNLNRIELEKNCVLSCEIADGTNSLRCSFDIPHHWDVSKVEYKFFKKEERSCAGTFLNKIEAIQLHFHEQPPMWISPNIYIDAHYKWPNCYTLEGNIHPFLEHKVLYVGQTIKQNLARRLGQHQKLKKILSLEDALNINGIGSSREIFIVCLEVLTKSIEVNRRTLANEVEAAIISKFNPHYNQVKFKKYPKISAGLWCEDAVLRTLTIETLPLCLYSSKYKMIGPSISWA